VTYRGKRILGYAALALVIVVPLSVHAGFFAALAGMLEEAPAPVAAEETVSHNAQTVPLLRAANHVDPNPAKGGGDIMISEDGALVSAGDAADGDSVNKYTANGEISVYIVREGDTLSQIAEMFDVSANTILWANDIKKASLIKPGMTLVILPITGVRHVVKDGDTLASIAKKYEGDVEEIIAYNQLESAADIRINDTIVVPGGSVSAPKTSTSGSVRSGGGVAVSTGSGSSNFSHPLPGALRTQGLHGYNGVDLAAGAGAPILAAASGQVIVAKASGWNGGYGNYVVVKHANGTQTLYAHLSTVTVAVGESVAAGEQIGVIGNTGRSTGTHLHFEVRGAKNPF
jgi:LysM repeat protein